MSERVIALHFEPMKTVVLGAFFGKNRIAIGPNLTEYIRVRLERHEAKAGGLVFALGDLLL